MRPTTKRIIAILSLALMLPLTIVTAIPASARHSNFRDPIAATYVSYGAPEGFARGELTVTVSGWVDTSGCPMEAVAYWANANGHLEGYTALARFKVTCRSTTFEFPTLQIIPEGADRLRVYTAQKGTEELSSVYVDAYLPANSDYDMSETPEYVFAVVSDTHVYDTDKADNYGNYHNRHFKDMLEDVSAIIASSNAKNSQTGIFINGDVIDGSSTQQGSADDLPLIDRQYAMVESLRQEACPDIPIYMAIGNHDLWPGSCRDDAAAKFLQNAKLPDGSHPSSLTYDFYIGDCHFVFLGDDDWDTNYATINDEHLAWLDETIAEGYENGKTFLFLHQSISNTVAGGITSYPEQAWHGIVNEAKVRELLRKYPDAVMFNGHSHWTLNAVNASFDGIVQSLPYAFTTSSVASPQNMQGVPMGNAESEGYIIEVYEDKILVRGRDFKRDLWMASAQFAIEYVDDVVDVLPPDEDNVQGSNNQTNNQNNQTNDQSNKKPSNNNSDKVIYGDDIGNGGNQTDDSGSIIDFEENDDKLGCNGAIGVAPLALAVIPAALVLKKKKS